MDSLVRSQFYMTALSNGEQTITYDEYKKYCEEQAERLTKSNFGRWLSSALYLYGSFRVDPGYACNLLNKAEVEAFIAHNQGSEIHKFLEVVGLRTDDFLEKVISDPRLAEKLKNLIDGMRSLLVKKDPEAVPEAIEQPQKAPVAALPPNHYIAVGEDVLQPRIIVELEDYRGNKQFNEEDELILIISLLVDDPKTDEPRELEREQINLLSDAERVAPALQEFYAKRKLLSNVNKLWAKSLLGDVTEPPLSHFEQDGLPPELPAHLVSDDF